MSQLPPALPPEQPSHPHQHSLQPVLINGTTQDDRTMGMLIHLLSLLTGIIGVLILWLVKRESSRFVDHHGKESLNFQISLLIYSIAIFLVTFVFSIITLGIGVFVMIPLYLLLVVGVFVLEIMALVAATKGEWYRIPMTIRFIR